MIWMLSGENKERIQPQNEEILQLVEEKGHLKESMLSRPRKWPHNEEKLPSKNYYGEMNGE